MYYSCQAQRPTEIFKLNQSVLQRTVKNRKKEKSMSDIILL